MRRTERYARLSAQDRASAAFLDKHGVDGVTAFPEDLSVARITVRKAQGAPMAETAMMHERGHVSVCEDLLDSGGDIDTLRGYDRWQNEVEAWVRGYGDTKERRRMTKAQGEFILDALNSYRRALGITDAEWLEGREVILDALAPESIHRHLRDYVPLEPEPNDRPPQCGGMGPPKPRDDDGDEGEDEDGEGESQEDDQDGDDESQGQGGEDDGREDGREDPSKPSEFDKGWNDQRVIDALTRGATVEDMVRQYGLDPTRVTPLAAVLAGQR